MITGTPLQIKSFKKGFNPYTKLVDIFMSAEAVTKSLSSFNIEQFNDRKHRRTMDNNSLKTVYGIKGH